MRVVIADDSIVVRSGIATLLAGAGVETVGEAGDSDALLRMVATTAPDAAVVDIRMPPTYSDEGIVAAHRIRTDFPDVAVLVLSQYVASSYAMRLLQENPSRVGYLLKDRVTDLDEFLDAVERVAAGGTAMDPEVVRQLFTRSTRNHGVEGLTPRERQVLDLMAQGLSNSAICTALVLAPVSVEKHITNIFAKLDLPPADDAHRRVRAVLTYLGS